MASVLVFRVECKLMVGLRGGWDRFVPYGCVAFSRRLYTASKFIGTYIELWM